MKKAISLLAAFAFICTMLAGCSTNDNTLSSSSAIQSESNDNTLSSSSAIQSESIAEADSPLTDILAKLYEGIPRVDEVESETSLPATIATELTEENSEFMLGIARSEFKEGIVSEAMMNAIAYSTALLRAENEEAAVQLAALVEKNANPSKWVCVTAEQVIVKQAGKLVLLVMGNATLAEQIAANFEALTAK